MTEKWGTAHIKVSHAPLKRAPVVLRLPFPPSVNNLFITARNGKRVISPDYREWRANAENCIVQQGRPRINGRVNVIMEFEDKPGRHDIDNLCKGPLDTLVHMFVIDADDSKVVRRLTVSWSDKPGCTVTITANEEPWIQRRNMARKA